MNTAKETMLDYLAEVKSVPNPAMTADVTGAFARLTARIVRGEMVALSDREMSDQLMMTAIHATVSDDGPEMMFSALVEVAAQLAARHLPTSQRPGTIVH